MINWLPEKFEASRLSAATLEEFHQHPLLKNLIVNASGYFAEARGHNLEREPIEDIVLIYCTQGKGFYRLFDQSYEVKKGDLLYCWKGVPHKYGADPQDPWTIHWVHFHGELAENLSLLSKAEPTKPVIKIGMQTELMRLFRQIYEILAKGHTLHHIIQASSILHQLLTTPYYLSKTLAEKKGLSKSQLGQLLQYMNENIKEKKSLEDFSQLAHLSPSHLVRKFKQQFGFTPMDYFNRLKIQTAAQILCYADISIKEVSHQYGFEDPLYFSRLFHKVMGQSPKEYRKLNHF